MAPVVESEAGGELAGPPGDSGGPQAAPPPPRASAAADQLPLSQLVPHKVAHREIYSQPRHALQYDLLVRCQDVGGAIPRALDALDCFPAGAVVELGAGSGKLTRLLAPLSRRVWALDSSPAMLDVARARLASEPSVEYGVADHRDLSLVPDGWADVVAAGWSLNYLHSDHWAGDWRAELEACMAEVRRVLRPGGGTVVVLETMGIGTESPTRLGNHLHAELLARGFGHTLFRTDWGGFPSPEAADRLLTFFFGKGVAGMHAASGRETLPEHTCMYVWQGAGPAIDAAGAKAMRPARHPHE